MRQEEIGRERGKRILDPNSAHTRHGGANSEKKQRKNSKNQRTTIRHYFQPNRDEAGREREKEFQTPIPLILDPGEKIPRENAKKFKKLKNNFPALFLAKTGGDRIRQAEKEIKVFQARIPLILDPGEQIPKKNSKKIQKIEKQLSGVIFSQNGMRQDEIGRERDKIIFDPNSAHNRLGGENCKKKTAKKFKKLKNNFPSLFSAKT